MRPSGRESHTDSVLKVTLLFLFALLPTAVWGQVAWKTSLSAAKQEAAANGKPILLVFHATWCGPCRMLEETTLRNPGVMKLLQGMTCVRLDVDHEQEAAKSFGVDSIPRILLLPAGGGAPLMDLLGYRDAEQFMGELREALHLTPVASATTTLEGSPELMQVRQALESHTFDALKRTNPGLAAAGLKGLVGQLGVFQEHEIDPTIALLRNAGDNAIPALMAGMGDRYLAVRAGSYRTLQTLLRERHITTPLRFDPWASTGERSRELKQWAAWWNRHQRK